MAARKPRFTLEGNPDIYFEKNRITGNVELSDTEIEQLAPRMMRLFDDLSVWGVNVSISATLNVEITDIDLFGHEEDETE